MIIEWQEFASSLWTLNLKTSDVRLCNPFAWWIIIVDGHRITQKDDAKTSAQLTENPVKNLGKNLRPEIQAVACRGHIGSPVRRKSLVLP